MADLPIAHWNFPPYLDIAGAYPVGACAFDRTGVLQVGLTLNGSAPVFVSSQQKNPLTGSFEYYGPLPGGLPTAQYTLGGVVQSNGGKSRTLPNRTVNIFSSAATYTDKYVDADSGDDTTGDGSAGNPFLTVKKALEGLSGSGDGGRIYLYGATAAYSVEAPSTTATTTNRYVNIEIATTNAAKATVVIDQWDDIGSDKVRLSGMTLSATVNGTGTLWLDDVHMKGAGQAVSIGANGWFNGWSEVYITEGEVSDCLESVDAAEGVVLCRNVTISDVGGAGYSGYTGSACIDTTVDTCTGQGVAFIDTGAVENAMLFNVTAYNASGRGLEMHTSTVTTFENVALVNVSTEGSGANRLLDISPVHFLLWNCGFHSSKFDFACSTPVNLSVRQTLFVRIFADAGDLVSEPTLPDSAFQNCHYATPTGGSLLLGSALTTGTPGYTDEANDDYTPAAASVLYASHDAPQLVRCDAEGVVRSDPTTVGPLKGADEPSGKGDAPPEGLSYSPTQTIGTTGSAIANIIPSWSGTVETFAVKPSFAHNYKAPDEIECDPEQAHFEIRKWVSGDGTYGDGTTPTWVVEDLRDNTVYIKNPKAPDPDGSGVKQFYPLAVAINLCAPHASEAAGVSLDGPWPGERPIIKITDPNGEFANGGWSGSGIPTGLPLNENHDQADYRVAAWASEPGIGGFFPFNSHFAAEGKGERMVFSVVGATGGSTDTFEGPYFGGGLDKTDGTNDDTYVMGDGLFKDLTCYQTITGSGGSLASGCFGTDWGSKSGRLRLYDVKFHIADNDTDVTIDPASANGFIMKTSMRMKTAMHYDMRRCEFPFVDEHGFYADLVNAGIYRDDGGTKPDSWFIDNVLPNGTGRTMFQLTDRPIDYASGPVPPTGLGSTTSLPGGRGTVLFQGNKILKPGGHYGGASWITIYGGCEIDFILRDNETTQPGLESDAELHTTQSGLVVPLDAHNRTLLVTPWNVGSVADPAAGVRHNSDGYPIKAVHLLSHFDHTDDRNGQRISLRGVQSVYIYDFELIVQVGALGRSMGLDETDSGSESWVAATPPNNEQWDSDGNYVYSAAIGFGTPIGANGTLYPSCKNVFLFMGYPNDPADFSGWIDGAVKIRGVLEDTELTWFDFTDTQVNGLAGTPVTLPTGVSIDSGTGVVSGTPTEGIGVDPATGTFFGTEIDAASAYPQVGGSYTGFARIPVRASNASSPDAWTSATFQMLIYSAIEIYVSAPVAVLWPTTPVSGLVVDAEVNVSAPVAIMWPIVGTAIQVDTETTTPVRPPCASIYQYVNMDGLSVASGINITAPIAAVYLSPIVPSAETFIIGAKSSTGIVLGLRSGAEVVKGI